MCSFKLLSQKHWQVRHGVGNPGNNHWNSNHVTFGKDGEIKLKMNADGCAEIFTKEPVSYGDYLFQLDSKFDDHHPNSVVGFFLYQDDKRELDIELSKWGNSNEDNLWYSIQPSPFSKFTKASTRVSLNGSYTTHRIVWLKGFVLFESFHGHGDLAIDSKRMFRHKYNNELNLEPSKTRLHINFWNCNEVPFQREEEVCLRVYYREVT